MRSGFTIPACVKYINAQVKGARGISHLKPPGGQYKMATWQLDIK
jgi:hypothetical protein